MNRRSFIQRAVAAVSVVALGQIGRVSAEPVEEAYVDAFVDLVAERWMVQFTDVWTHSTYEQWHTPLTTEERVARDILQEARA